MRNPNIINGVSLKEIGIFSLKTSAVALGLYHIATGCLVNEFIGWLHSFNPSRASSLQSAIRSHEADELDLLREISALNTKQGIALANKIGRMDIKEGKGKLHRALLNETGRVSREMLEHSKKKK